MKDLTAWTRSDIEAEYGVDIVGYKAELDTAGSGTVHVESLQSDTPQQFLEKYEDDSTTVVEMTPIITLSSAITACGENILTSDDDT